MRVILVADAVNKGNVPRVHTEHVIQLVDAELFHFARLEFGAGHGREGDFLFFDIGRYIGVGKYFKDVSDLITVENPASVGAHRVPGRVILDGISCRQAYLARIAFRKRHGGSVAAYVAEVDDHVGKAVFDSVQAFFFSKPVFGGSLGLVGKNQFVQGVQGVGVSVCPTCISRAFKECAPTFVACEPTAFKVSCSGTGTCAGARR